MFRRAVAVIGPHGGQLWNIAFAKPGTLVVEFNTWHDVFMAKDCRTCGYSLANAAGHKYWIVEPAKFSYEAHSLMPPPAEVVGIVSAHLDSRKEAKAATG